MRERDVENYLKKKVKEAGGQIRKVKWIGRASAPDRLVMAYGTSIYVELKRPGKDATRAQQREHAYMRQAGNYVVVINSLRGVDELFDLIRKPDKGESFLMNGHSGYVRGLENPEIGGGVKGTLLDVTHIGFEDAPLAMALIGSMLGHRVRESEDEPGIPAKLVDIEV